MRESCYPLCGWLSSLWFYPSDKTIQYISTENLRPPTFCVAIILSTSCPKKFCSDIKSLPIFRDYGSDFLFLRVSIRRSGLSGSPPIEWLLWSMSECLAISYSLPLPHPLFSPLCPNWVKDNERTGRTIGWNLGLLGFACSSTACCSIISPPEPNPPAPPPRLSLFSISYKLHSTHTSHDFNHLCPLLDNM